MTAIHLRLNRDDFLPFLCNQDTGDPMSETEFESYCNKVEKTAAWGGQIEVGYFLSQFIFELYLCFMYIVLKYPSFSPTS